MPTTAPTMMMMMTPVETPVDSSVACAAVPSEKARVPSELTLYETVADAAEVVGAMTADADHSHPGDGERGSGGGGGAHQGGHRVLHARCRRAGRHHLGGENDRARRGGDRHVTGVHAEREGDLRLHGVQHGRGERLDGAGDDDGHRDLVGRAGGPRSVPVDRAAPVRLVGSRAVEQPIHRGVGNASGGEAAARSSPAHHLLEEGQVALAGLDATLILRRVEIRGRRGGVGAVRVVGGPAATDVVARAVGDVAAIAGADGDAADVAAGS